MYRRVIALSAALIGILAGGSLALAQDTHPHEAFKAFRTDGKNLFVATPDGKWIRVQPRVQENSNVDSDSAPHATRFVSQQKLGDYYIGLALGDVSDTLRSQLKLDDGVGIVVADVADETPAREAELMQHDVLVRVDGEQVVSPQMLIDAVQNAGGEDRTMRVEYLRAGEMKELELKPQKRNADDRVQFPRSVEATPEQEQAFAPRLPETGQITPEWILENLQRGGNQAELQEQIDQIREQLEGLRGVLEDQSGNE
ncbi:MAG: PDZ domain-containing protein [Pirellulaceae bacterium]|nr:PDZ domain-containing protein [Pirellulaceae bacterium]